MSVIRHRATELLTRLTGHEPASQTCDLWNHVRSLSPVFAGAHQAIYELFVRGTCIWTDFSYILQFCPRCFQSEEVTRASPAQNATPVSVSFSGQRLSRLRTFAGGRTGAALPSDPLKYFILKVSENGLSCNDLSAVLLSVTKIKTTFHTQENHRSSGAREADPISSIFLRFLGNAPPIPPLG